MNQEGTVAVVIPSWNSRELLPRCLGALGDQGVKVETMVVDNGSSDGSVAYLEQAGVPHISLPHNTGFSAAVNLGAARVSAPWIFVLNADAVLEPGALSALAAALEGDPTLGGVQPQILQLEDGQEASGAAARIYSVGQRLSRDGRAFEAGAGLPQGAGSVRGGEVFGVCGAACLLRRELFDQLGGYDERYFAFYEDVDLNVRGRIAGWRFACVPEAVAWHVGNASWMAEAPEPGAWNARLVARNRIATQIKFMPMRALPRILAVEVGSLLRSLTQRRFGATLRGKVEGLFWLPTLLRERRRLRQEGDLTAPRKWLGR